MAIALRNHKMDAFYSVNKTTGSCTISLLGSGMGGPIVTANSLEEAKIKFERALSLSTAIKNLLFFKGMKHKYSSASKRSKSPELEISYLQVA